MHNIADSHKVWYSVYRYIEICWLNIKLVIRLSLYILCWLWHVVILTQYHTLLQLVILYIKLDKISITFLTQFPRLQGTCTLKIYKIVFILHPEPEDEYSRNGGEIGQINMSKVRSYVTSLGDNLPEGARGLMQSMEEFQQVQIYIQSSSVLSNINTCTNYIKVKVIHPHVNYEKSTMFHCIN